MPGGLLSAQPIKKKKDSFLFPGKDSANEKPWTLHRSHAYEVGLLGAVDTMSTRGLGATIMGIGLESGLERGQLISLGPVLSQA